MILHYIQSHAPHIESVQSRGRQNLHEYEVRPVGYINENPRSNAGWNGYMTELRSVLDSIKRRLISINSNSDYREAFDEFNG